MKTALTVLVAVVVLAAIGAAGVGLWSLERKIHYDMSYKAMVKQTIIEMVKEDALKNPPGKGR